MDTTNSDLLISHQGHLDSTVERIAGMHTWISLLQEPSVVEGVVRGLGGITCVV